MIFSAYHIKHKILTSVITSHGITDLIHATQNNTTKQLLSMNTLCIMSSVGLSQNDVTILGLNTCFIALSIIHFRHDYPILFKTDKYEDLQKCMLSFISIIMFYINHDLFFYIWFFSMSQIIIILIGIS